MENKLSKLEQDLMDLGYEDVLIFKDFDYADAFIGISHDNRAIYDYEKMVKSLVDKEGMTELEAIEWIDYNTLRALPYYEGSPIIMYPIDIDNN